MFLCCSCLSDLGSLLEAKDDVITDEVDSVSEEAYERRIKRLESEKNTLSHKLSGRGHSGFFPIWE